MSVSRLWCRDDGSGTGMVGTLLVLLWGVEFCVWIDDESLSWAIVSTMEKPRSRGLLLTSLISDASLLLFGECSGLEVSKCVYCHS